MGVHTGFQLPRICLPRPEIDLKKWAVVACDQYTSEPEYWRKVAHEVGDAPSSLHLIFPESYLGSEDAPARIHRIQETMRSYLAKELLYEREGAIYVERTIGHRVRRGLMLELDLEHYDFGSGSTSLIRPTASFTLKLPMVKTAGCGQEISRFSVRHRRQLLHRRSRGCVPAAKKA